MRSLALGLALVLALPQTARSAPPEYDPDAPYEAQRPKFEYREPEPPSGGGVIGLGITGVAFGGSVTGLGGFVLLAGTDAVLPWLLPLGLGIGLISLGTVGIVVGARRHAAWKKWASSKPSARARLTPSGWANRGGFGFGVTGRF